MAVDTCSTAASDISYCIIIIDTNRTQSSRLPNRTIIDHYNMNVYILQAAFLFERPVQYVRTERT